MNFGIICPSEIAFRRFMPALEKIPNCNFVGVAYANEEEWFGDKSEENNLNIIEEESKKAKKILETYGGKIFDSYASMMNSPEIDCVYLPLPPALHFKWAKMALENGKHLLCEKPFTTSLKDTIALLELAKKKNLAVHENYMFKYHSQIDEIKTLVCEDAIGDIRLIRISFGFPFRGANDFRYNKALGGGALLDCGGYTLKLATEFLGDTAKIATSNLNYKDDFEVDIYGSATMTNDDGLTAQLSFGMDNSYKCDIEIWGNEGTIYTNRILTAPDGFEPTLFIRKGNEETVRNISADNSFLKSIQKFSECIDDVDVRYGNMAEILKQAELVEKFL